MNTHSPAPTSHVSPWARWRWISEWPAPAQYALVFVMFLSGSSLMGHYRWVQGVICLLWVGWLILEVHFNRDNPRLQAWSRWRRALFTVLGIAGLGYILLDLLSLVK